MTSDSWHVWQGGWHVGVTFEGFLNGIDGDGCSLQDMKMLICNQSEASESMILGKGFASNSSIRGGCTRLITRFLPSQLLSSPLFLPSPPYSLSSHPSLQPFNPSSPSLSPSPFPLLPLLVAGPHCLPPAAPTRRRRLVGSCLATQHRAQPSPGSVPAASLASKSKEKNLKIKNKRNKHTSQNLKICSIKKLV